MASDAEPKDPGESESRAIREYLRAIGRKGGKAGTGKKGVRKGFATLSPEERSALARKAARARWGKKPTE